MKYWLFDVAWLSKLNVVSVTNPPPLFGNILNLVVVVVNCVKALRCPFNHTVSKFKKSRSGKTLLLAGPNVWQEFFLSATLVIFQKSIMLSSQLGDQDDNLTFIITSFCNKCQCFVSKLSTTITHTMRQMIHWIYCVLCSEKTFGVCEQ